MSWGRFFSDKMRVKPIYLMVLPEHNHTNGLINLWEIRKRITFSVCGTFYQIDLTEFTPKCASSQYEGHLLKCIRELYQFALFYEIYVYPLSTCTFVGRAPPPPQNDYVIIHEIYENDNASEYFESELEQALETRIRTIIIEPSKLGDETARWITVGNCLHKTSVLCGLGCLMTGITWPDKGFVYFPLGFCSIVCAGVYTVSWQFDPCCKYQVEYNSHRLQRLPLHNLTSSSPVVLVRKDDTRRKILHNLLAGLSTAYCAWRFYDWYFEQEDSFTWLNKYKELDVSRQ